MSVTSTCTHSVIFIMRKIGTPDALKTKPTPLTALWLDNPLHLMQSSSTIHAINITTNPTATNLTHIVYHHLSIPLSSRMGDSLCHCIKMISLPLANHILQGLAVKPTMPTPSSYAWAQWWISHLILRYLHTTSFNSMMGLPNWYMLLKCCLSFLNHLPIHLIPATFCLRSYISTLKSRTNTTVSTTRVTYQSHKMEHTASATNHTSTRKSKTGAYHQK